MSEKSVKEVVYSVFCQMIAAFFSVKRLGQTVNRLIDSANYSNCKKMTPALDTLNEEMSVDKLYGLMSVIASK